MLPSQQCPSRAGNNRTESRTGTQGGAKRSRVHSAKANPPPHAWTSSSRGRRSQVCCKLGVEARDERKGDVGEGAAGEAAGAAWRVWLGPPGLLSRSRRGNPPKDPAGVHSCPVRAGIATASNDDRT